VAMKEDTPTVPEGILRFVIKDNGKGIDEKDLKRIFQPFQQASSSTESVYGGTGLGLAITQKIVTALGGTISVESKKGSWSKFTVDLPCSDAPMNVLDVSAKVQKWAIHMVGFSEPEKSKAIQLLGVYQIDALIFSSMKEMLASMSGPGGLLSDQIHVCLIHEECFDERLLPEFSKTTFFTVGPQFSVDEAMIAHHFRSFDHMIPSVFINTLMSNVARGLNPNDTLTARSKSFSGPEGLFSQMKILIAEDNIVNQKVLSQMLRRLNVKHIDIVGNGQEACNKVETNSYDLILMDQQMPIMGGVAACQQILARPGIQRHPTIVFVTAHVSASFEAECLEAGGSGFVPKPFKLDVIEKCLRQIYSQTILKR
jgi:CheY-like chemotaxis protein